VSEAYGKFQLLKKLATGGMAQIYLARHAGIEGFERLCVVKRILPHLAENRDFVQMFLDEAKIAARLNHPNIVQIYDLGALDESYFIAMEFIHGEDLRRIWKRADRTGRELPIAFVLRVIADACAGLDYAHKKNSESGRPLNIVHRDISPQNVLVSFEGAVKVVDFGIAKAADKMTETRSGVLKGKYSYMSPEQAAGRRDVDARTDIFALGVLLYELLTGTRLFKRGSDMATLRAVTECVVAPPSAVNTRVPQDLDPIVMKALARTPAERFQHAVELQLALEGWLLEHQLPASSAQVAAFMRELYGDRLEAEKAAGQPLPDLSESWSIEEEFASRRRSGSRPRASGPSAELTAGMRPSRSPVVRTTPPAALRTMAPLPVTELPPETALVQTNTRPNRPRRRHLLGVMVLAMIVGASSVALWRLWPAQEVTTAKPVPVTTAPPQPLPSRPAVVRLAVRSEPVGAQLFVEGEPRGTTLAELQLRPGERVNVRAELAGFETLVRTVRVGEGPEQTELLSLQPSRQERVVRPQRPERDPEPAPVRATGSLRFAFSPVEAYANVRCGHFDLGQAPGIGDQRIPVGTYECTFINPELGIRKRRVEVRPNARTTVKVEFDQD
jgi:eukaryotic-like serine/threonine-protein kinase